MTTDIPALIEKRPHLKDPLELYAKWQRFQQEVIERMPEKAREKTAAVSPEESKGYPQESAGAVWQLFVDIFGLPKEEMEPLRQALENGDIDFMRLPIDEYPLLPSLPYSEEEQAGILFLLCRPYFLALRDTFPLDGSPWEDGRCPLCSARAALTSVIEGPKRNLHCSFCGTSGPYRFIGCPNCASVDTAKLNSIVSEDEPGFRVVTCDACQTYVKVMEGTVLREMTMDQADMCSLPLDIIAQGKGYARMAPNPISLKKIE
jgi:FdhE protein